MHPPKTVGPAIARNDEPTLNSEQLTGELNHSNNGTVDAPQADDTGESDYAFFSRRPGVNTRVRLPFENEYPICVLAPGRGAFVRILIERSADGQPRRARRRLRFCDGGRA
jgi:hypothetical protein